MPCDLLSLRLQNVAFCMRLGREYGRRRWPLMVIKVSFTGDGCIPKNVKRLLLFAHFGMNERNVLCLKRLCLHAIPARICAVWLVVLRRRPSQC